MQPIYVSKNIITASSTCIGLVAASTAVGSLNATPVTLDSARRVITWSMSGDQSTATFTVTGTGETGNPLSERIQGSSATGVARSGLQDFLTISAIQASSVMGSSSTFGTSSQGGTAWKQVNTHISPIMLGAYVALTSTANSMTASIDYTFDDISGNYPNPNSSYSMPYPFTSTAITAVASYANGILDRPINAWRLTLTSSSSNAGSAYATVIQSGIG